VIIAPMVKDGLPVPLGFEPAAGGNITWAPDSRNYWYLEVDDLIQQPMMDSGILVGQGASIDEAPLLHYVRLMFPSGAMRNYRLNAAINLPEQFLNSGNRISLQLYETVSTDIDILALVNAFVDKSDRVVDPFDDYKLYDRRNWNGFDAEPVTAETLRSARRIYDMLPDDLGEPHIAPGADGSIGFYWSADNGSFRSLCIDIGPGEKWRAYWQLKDNTFDSLSSRQITSSTRANLEFIFTALSPRS
jgi:hypothetical protein